MLNGFSVDLKYWATALQEPGSRLVPWCQSCPMTTASCVLRSSSGCQRTLTKVTPVGGNEYSTHLNQSPSQNFQELVLLALQLRNKRRGGLFWKIWKRRKQSRCCIWTFPAWQITSWIINLQLIKSSINQLGSSPTEGNRWMHLHIIYLPSLWEDCQWLKLLWWLCRMEWQGRALAFINGEKMSAPLERSQGDVSHMRTLMEKRKTSTKSIFIEYFCKWVQTPAAIKTPELVAVDNI